jgi:hypothetical protein
MEYQIAVRDTGESMRVTDEDWRYLLMLAGTFGWNPVAGIDHYLSIPPPDVVPSSVSRYLAETLNRSCLTCQKGAVPSTYRFPKRVCRSWSYAITLAENARA